MEISARDTLKQVTQNHLQEIRDGYLDSEWVSSKEYKYKRRRRRWKERKGKWGRE